MQSSIPKVMSTAIRDTPGIRKNSANNPLVVSEAIVMIEARRELDKARVNFPMVGVTAGLSELRPELQVTAGRMFTPGLHELIANRVCDQQYDGFAIGDVRHVRGAEWSIVGHFSPGKVDGSCSLYADADSMMSAFGRNSFNQMTLMLPSPSSFQAFQAAIGANPVLQVEAKREREVVAQATRQFTKVLNFASLFVGTIMALGATFGAANSLHTIVEGRRREMTTLRALGFSPSPILTAVIVEATLLAIFGALLGTALAWLLFNGMSASPMGVSFRLAVTPTLVGIGLLWALVMGLLSGLPSALRTIQQPITEALRAT
jgi:putative ABC transport system permease protein